MRDYYPNNPNTWPKNYSSEYPDYLQIGEALFCQYGQKLTLKQLESCVSKSNQWDDWKRNVRELNVLPAWMVNFLFDNPTLKWNFDIIDSSIEHSIGSFRVYIGENAQFSLNKVLLQAGAKILSWNTSTGNCDIISQSDGTVRLIFM